MLIRAAGKYDLTISIQFYSKQSKVKRNDATEPAMGDTVPMIYMCATMWHEEENEMKQLLKSLLR